MNDLPPNQDEETVEAWLRTRPPEDARAIALRAAMRVLPLWTSAMVEDWARSDDLTATPILRLNLALGVARKYPSPTARTASIAATRGAASALTASAASAAFTAASAVIASVASTLTAAARSASNSAALTAGASDSADVWQNVWHDAEQLLDGVDIIPLPLWTGQNPLDYAWQASVPILRATPGGEFWIDWYQRALDGRPQNWPLLHDVALIEDTLWEQGGDALAREIKRTVERHELLAEVRHLRLALADAREDATDTPHRGHNNPPELLGSVPADVTSAIAELPGLLDEAEKVLVDRNPSPSEMRGIGVRIGAAIRKVAAYTATLCDQFLQSFAKEAGASVGKSAGPAIIVIVALKMPSFNNLFERLMQLAGP